jgi:hypothetical protein
MSSLREVPVFVELLAVDVFAGERTAGAARVRLTSRATGAAGAVDAAELAMAPALAVGAGSAAIAVGITSIAAGTAAVDAGAVALGGVGAATVAPSAAPASFNL